MIRTFQTHKVRNSRELSSSLWNFSTILDDGTKVNKQVMVPSCWESYPETVAFRGVGVYEKEFSAEGNLRFEMKGVGHTATVFLDGKEIARHYNAFTPFSCVVKNVKPGIHKLSIQADNRFSEDSALHVPNDYQTYGGITRGVLAEELNDIFVEWVHVRPRKTENCWNADFSVSLKNVSEKAFEGEIRIDLCADEEQNGLTKENEITLSPKHMCIHLDPGETKTFSLENEECKGVREWNMSTPYLYKVNTQIIDKQGIIVDDLIDRVGFRSVEICGKDILLNGEKIKIKGFCRHEDHPQFGSALPASAIMQDLLIMRDLGANSVRTSHYPNDEIFLDLCDELGMLVWEENHARGLSEEAMRNPNFERQCEDCIREMIQAHYNHPSIYIWGILNECASHTEYGSACYAKQFAQIRSMDDSRPCSFASCQFKTDISFGLVDVVSYNIYPLWYHNTDPKEYMEELYQWIQNDTQGAGKPFLITEVGAGAIYGYHTPTKVKWSEEYQAQALKKQLTAILNYEDCSGVYIWQFCDCRISEEWFANRPRTMNNKGIVDEYRRPKLAYETVKEIFSQI